MIIVCLDTNGYLVKMKVKLYPRVSSKKQAEEGDSVEFQEKRLKQHSMDNNDEIISIHTDAGKSASISDDKMEIWHKDGYIYAKIDIKKRKGMNEILNDLKKSDWECLKITKWDRFSRSNVFSKLMQIYFERNNKNIIPTDDSIDPLMVDIKGALSEEEIRKMKERVRNSRLIRFEKGIMPGRSPFGYKPIVKDNKIIGFKPDTKKSNIVKEIFKLSLEKINYKEICKRFKIKPQQYYNIIRNPVYSGFVTFEGKIKKGIHSPLIDFQDFKKLNPNFNHE